jgi:hypothetical protein
LHNLLQNSGILPKVIEFEQNELIPVRLTANALSHAPH